jgi:Fibronectin type III domain
MTSRRGPTRGRRAQARRPITFLALVASVVVGMLVGGTSLVTAQTAGDPSDVVLVFDVSDSILDSDDGTNVQFAAALEGIADRVVVIADDLAAGNATVSFVAFGRRAIAYPDGCQRLALHENAAAVTRFEDCLRKTAAEYRAGRRAPVKQRINTAATDYVAALEQAAALLPAGSSRSAVVFFTDGEHNPPGTDRDHENVVAKVTPAFAGRTPLAILPVGLGTGAGAFESALRAIYDAFLRDMQPCEGRPIFAWPEVVFPSGAEAGAAVALALQEVTCSFTVAPTPTPVPTPTPPPPEAPIGVQVLAGNESLTVQWLPPSTGVVVDYVVHCRPATGGDWIESTEGVSTTTETVIEGLQPGVAYDCEVAASNGTSTGPFAAAAASTVVLGIPGVPGQPRVEPMDGAARLSVDPVAGGAPVEQYDYECTSAAGHTAVGAGPEPNVVVTGLTNGETFACVAYTENRIGRSAPSPASASFMPCGGLFGCNPWLIWVVGGGVILAILGGLLILARLYARRNRVWVTAQVDGGANRPLGWGPHLGIALDQDDAGWYAAPRPLDRAPIRVRYQGKNRFLVQSSAGLRDVHQGDPASVREGRGDTHQLILRSYRRRSGEEAPTVRRAPADTSGEEVVARLDRTGTSSTPEDGGPAPA